MRVVHLNTERTWRGGERQTFWLARELRRRNHGSWVACRPGHPLEATSRSAGLTTVPLRPWFEMDPCAASRLKDFLKRENVDVLHAHTGHAVGLGALATLGTSTRLVATRRVDFHLKGNLLTRWKYRRVSAVVAISQKVRDILGADGMDPAKITVVPSGIEASGYPKHHRAAADLRRQKKIDPQEKIIVNAAALVPHKDQATLLAAMPEVLVQVPEARLLILGDGVLRRSLETKARALHLDGRVDFLGHRPDVLEYIALADVFVLSSKEEGLGTSLIDAMAIGTPTVATSGGGIPDIYGAAEGLVQPGDSADLARQIVAVLKDPAEAGRRVERGTARAAAFTVEKMADRYEKIYENIVNR